MERFTNAQAAAEFVIYKFDEGSEEVTIELEVDPVYVSDVIEKVRGFRPSRQQSEVTTAPDYSVIFFIPANW